MKNYVQIADYIRKARWFGEFLENLRRERGSHDINDFLNGLYGEETIVDAFVWAKTPQGRSYWDNANGNFLDWLNG